MTAVSRRKSPAFVATATGRLVEWLASRPAALAVVMLGCAFLAGASPPIAAAASGVRPPVTSTAPGSSVALGGGGSSLEAAAAKAGDMGRKVAMSLIGLALAVGGTVLLFRRDFRKVAGVLVLGLLAILLASPAGVGVLQDTVGAVFGAS